MRGRGGGREGEEIDYGHAKVWNYSLYNYPPLAIPCGNILVRFDLLEAHEHW